MVKESVLFSSPIPEERLLCFTSNVYPKGFLVWRCFPISTADVNVSEISLFVVEYSSVVVFHTEFTLFSSVVFVFRDR